MTLGSLFDGIGVFCLAAQNAGIKPVWASEIEAFPLSVTARHFPNVIQLGDINVIETAPHVDIITAGSPCTDLSIAGKRSGIRGKKSGLFFRAIELVRRIRPEFFVWENVTGAFSSNGGNDFRAVLEEILEEPVPLPEHSWSNAGLVDGKRSQVAWRVCDAQYWGVPQRRRRIFLVASFGSRRAAQVLFEPQSVRGNSQTGTGEEEDASAQTRKTTEGEVGFNAWGTSVAAQRELIPTQRANNVMGVAVYDMTHADEVIRPVRGDKVNCLNARMGMGGNQIQLVAYGIGRDAFNQGANAKFNPTIDEEVQPPLTARRAGAVAKGVVRRLTPLECERLMGLPDRWTEGGSDTARYKALGNALVLPIAEWILKRLQACSNAPF